MSRAVADDRPPLAPSSASAWRAERRVQLCARRALDLIVAVTTLMLLAPVLAIIAIVIRCTSTGPVLFRQVRVGQDEVPFTMLKFRTMRDGTHLEVLADEEQLERYRANDFKLAADDPRITRVGRILRSTSLDELPQLFNVLLGDMSLVGIRPVEPAQFDMRGEADRHVYRLLRPGITGLWQVEGRGTAMHEERLALDRAYIDSWSIGRDLVLLARTPLAVLRTRYGD